MYAALYHAMTPLGFSAQEVEAMEPWQAAAHLGLAIEDEEAGLGELLPGAVPIDSTTAQAAVGNLWRAD